MIAAIPGEQASGYPVAWQSSLLAAKCFVEFICGEYQDAVGSLLNH
jgi:hypothetical protein